MTIKKIFFITLFVATLLIISQVYFKPKDLIVNAIDTTQASWKVEIKNTISLSKVRTLGGVEKVKKGLIDKLNKKLINKNIKTSVSAITQGNNNIFISSLEGKTTLKEMSTILYSNLDSEVNLLGGATEIHIKGNASKNKRIAILLESNPSTGYIWSISNKTNNSVVEASKTNLQVKKKYVNNKDIVGTPMTQTVYTKTTKEGQNDIYLIYKRNWEKEIPQKTIDISIDNLSSSVDLSNTPTLSTASFLKNKLISLNLVSNFISSFTNKKSSDSRVKGVISLPSAFDWRNQASLPTVKNQGACGSCWAFSGQAVFESVMAIQKNITAIDSSEQFLVSCNIYGWGCGGGGIIFPFDINRIGSSQTVAGAVLEADFPYTATNGVCRPNLNHPYRGVSWASVSPVTGVSMVDLTKQTIYQHGPVHSPICVGPAFQSYRGGIFSTDESSYCNGGVNHGVVLVGWDDSKGAWILRNSWGPTWGDGTGHMYITYGTSNIDKWPSYMDYIAIPTPTLVPTSTPIPTSTPKPTSTPVPTATATPRPTATPIPVPSTDTIPPTVMITNPVNGAVFSKGTSVNITASAQDNSGGSGINKVEFYVNNSLRCSDTASPYLCKWKITGKGGSFNIEARAYDKSSNISSSKINITSK